MLDDGGEGTSLPDFTYALMNTVANSDLVDLDLGNYER